MALVGQESRSRIGIEWWETEEEALERAFIVLKRNDPETLAAANVGYVQCGRASWLDREVNGVKQYAVVTP